MALESKKLADQAARSLIEKGAVDVRIIDLREITSIVDFFVIGSAGSAPQLKALVEQVTDDLEASDTPAWHTEGKQSWRWVLIDYIDVVVHIFLEETRSFYGLERLWGDAPTVRIYTDIETGEIKEENLSQISNEVLEQIEN